MLRVLTPTLKVNYSGASGDLRRMGSTGRHSTLAMHTPISCAVPDRKDSCPNSSVFDRPAADVAIGSRRSQQREAGTGRGGEQSDGQAAGDVRRRLPQRAGLGERDRLVGEGGPGGEPAAETGG